MKMVITNAGFKFFYWQIKIHVYLQKNNSLISLKWQPHLTTTYSYNNDMIFIYPIWYMNSRYVQYTFLHSRM